MRWLLTYICPPLAVLLCGKPFSAILNVFLTLCLWKPGMRHAQWVLQQHMDDKRARLVANATHHPKWVNAVFTHDTKPLQVQHGKCAARPAKKLKAPAIEVVDQPDVGMNGTRFRKRSELN